MEKTITQDRLVDLGRVSSETLGGALVGTDESFGKMATGLSDD